MPLFQRAADIDPASGGLQRNLATALYDTHDLDGAVAHARQAIVLRPGDAQAYDLLGRALFEQGHVEPALAQLEQAARLAPDDAEIRGHLARALRFHSSAKSPA